MLFINFDNEQRNKAINDRMDRLITAGHTVCLWPTNIEEKDINDMVLGGYTDVKSIIDASAYSGLEAKLRLSTWRRT